ncbi:MAG: bifunctional phosphoribosylaminoimidazolecarboxamide formyltransferase/IMP cyclohydrolase [Thermoplasmata archaeon]|nr:bifunctional phosphoribosylaminoimidazolecarboxamide formyltransferase/IMP cyclohydrolase [Thermoplasmata archaeon]
MPPDDAGLVRVRRALISVDDKAGLTDLGVGLHRLEIELVATGGTRQALLASGTPVRAAEDLTGIGSWFGGRIKTLHPGLLGGILAPRTKEGDQELARLGLLPIDLVVVNFYPFARHLREHPSADDREEFIDIGGLTLARSAAKNHGSVASVSDPSEYPRLLEELSEHGGSLSATTRRELAVRTFARCADYDRRVASGLDRTAAPAAFPDTITFQRETLTLRYGENPHQAAQVYRLADPVGGRMVPGDFELLKGDRLSYTNLVDLDTALGIVGEFPTPTAAIVKHATPCGVASGTTIREALERAIATDPVARYGCAIAVNRPLEAGDTSALHGVFVDLLSAPEVADGTRTELKHREKLKLVRAGAPTPDLPRWDARTALGRLLVQEADRRQLVPNDFRPVTSRTATPTEACALDFAWRVVRHAKSNAVVLADGSRTVGIGSGQPTRVKAVELAVEVAGDRAKGSVLASDAFFPFADGVEAAGRAGVAAIIQPGGSLRDTEVIQAAERANVAMYFTGWRVFRH